MIWCMEDDQQAFRKSSRDVGDCLVNRDQIENWDILCAPQIQAEQFLDDDWCLPTIGELMLMHKNLALRGLGDFQHSPSQYWTSSVLFSPYVVSYNFERGEEMLTMSDTSLYVRPVRLLTL